MPGSGSCDAPARVAAITGLPVEAIVGLARRYGRIRAAFIRVGIGLSPHERAPSSAETSWRHLAGTTAP